MSAAEQAGAVDPSADVDLVRARLAALGRAPTPTNIAAVLRAEGRAVTDTVLTDTADELRRSSVGAGPLDDLLAAPGVTDVVVNGPDQVFLDRGHGLERSSVRFRNDAEVRQLAQRLAASVGRRLDDALPYVDARLADGTRVHAVLGGIAAPGTCLSLRVPKKRSFSLDDCVDSGSLSRAGAQVLEQLVAARLAFLISGGTGSGKTTLLSALLACVPPTDRIVIVEDSRELDPDHPHVVRLEGRPANAEQVGAITLTDLVRQSLRMRPDRLVVGEVRGAEVADLLAAMNTGHEGGCGTVHANSALDVPARLEALAALGGLGRDALHAQAGAALQAVIHVSRASSGSRRVAGVFVLVRDDATGRVCVQPALTFTAARGVVRGPGGPALEAMLS